MNDLGLESMYWIVEKSQSTELRTGIPKHTPPLNRGASCIVLETSSAIRREKESVYLLPPVRGLDSSRTASTPNSSINREGTITVTKLSPSAMRSVLLCLYETVCL